MKSRRIRVLFDLNHAQMAVSMALAARDDERGGDPVAFVRAMDHGEVLSQYRNDLWAYGALSWPNDFDTRAYDAARARVREWYG